MHRFRCVINSVFVELAEPREPFDANHSRLNADVRDVQVVSQVNSDSSTAPPSTAKFIDSVDFTTIKVNSSLQHSLLPRVHSRTWIPHWKHRDNSVTPWYGINERLIELRQPALRYTLLLI